MLWYSKFGKINRDAQIYSIKPALAGFFMVGQKYTEICWSHYMGWVCVENI